MLEWRFERGEGARLPSDQEGFYRKGNGTCESPEPGGCQAYLSKSKNAHTVGAERPRRRPIGKMSTEEGGGVHAMKAIEHLEGLVGWRYWWRTICWNFTTRGSKLESGLLLENGVPEIEIRKGVVIDNDKVWLRSKGWGKGEKTITTMRDSVVWSKDLIFRAGCLKEEEKVIWKQKGGLGGTCHLLPSPAVDQEEKRTTWEGCRGGKSLKDSQVFLRIETWRNCSENAGMNCSEDANEWLSSQGQRHLREERCGQNMGSQRSHEEIRVRDVKTKLWRRAGPTLVVVGTTGAGGQEGGASCQNQCAGSLPDSCHSLPPEEQAPFPGMAAVTVPSDFGAQENNICHCCPFFPFCFPWSDGTLPPWKESYGKHSVLKSRDISLLTKICIFKAMVFPVVVYRCDNWAIKMAVMVV